MTTNPLPVFTLAFLIGIISGHGLLADEISLHKFMEEKAQRIICNSSQAEFTTAEVDSLATELYLKIDRDAKAQEELIHFITQDLEKNSNNAMKRYKRSLAWTVRPQRTGLENLLLTESLSHRQVHSNKINMDVFRKEAEASEKGIDKRIEILEKLDNYIAKKDEGHKRKLWSQLKWVFAVGKQKLSLKKIVNVALKVHDTVEQYQVPIKLIKKLTKVNTSLEMVQNSYPVVTKTLKTVTSLARPVIGDKSNRFKVQNEVGSHEKDSVIHDPVLVNEEIDYDKIMSKIGVQIVSLTAAMIVNKILGSNEDESFRQKLVKDVIEELSVYLLVQLALKTGQCVKEHTFGLIDK